ncbi:S8 family peptidase [Actinospica robiniae]|uniref:S8 family peptidase n=1 Tax=Actinospica robiniae TaxID=304901 RepID=UPI00146F9EC1|nr:S8 family serine peptidase [Actinospica robiniae]
MASGTDNPIADKEWALQTLKSNTIHSQYGARGSGVVVAVIDSGVDPQQPDLQGSLVDGVNLVNPLTPTNNFSDDDTVESHGTSIATVIAGHAHSDGNGGQTGMIGLADQAKIMPIKVEAVDSSTAPALDAGFKYAADHGAKVISISITQAGACPADLTDAVDYALSHGVVVVAATGNTATSTNASSCPGNVPGVIDVAAFDQGNRMDKNSHYGSDVTVAAPGVDIEGGLIGGKYGENSGSSQAAPWVSAEAALIIGMHPTWTAGQVVSTIIDNTAQVVAKQSKAGSRYDDHIGYGIIDPLAALGAAAPSNTANPLGGPAVTASGGASTGASTGASGGATAPGGSGNQPPTASGGGKSSSSGPIIGIVVAIVVIGGLVLFFVTRRNRRGGPGGPGGGGGGGGNGYYPPTPPGGQYAPPPQGYQQPNPYQQQLPQQGAYQPQQGGGGYGQQQQPGGYGQQQQQQQPGAYGQQPQQQPPQPPAGGYGQQPGNPYQGR